MGIELGQAQACYWGFAARVSHFISLPIPAVFSLYVGTMSIKAEEDAKEKGGEEEHEYLLVFPY